MNHDALRALVLCPEDLADDLTDEEREIVRIHLTQCASCRELLARLKRMETLAADLGSLPSATYDELYRLPRSEAAAERASRQALKSRLDAKAGVGGKR